MKKLVLILLLVPLYLSVSAQNLDKLTLTNDQVIKCTVTQVTEDVISYKIEDENGQIESYSVPFTDVEVLESYNKFIYEKYMDIKADKSVPAGVEFSKATIFVIGGAVVGVTGLGLIALSKIPGALQTQKRGQLSATGITMTVVGGGLVGLGLYQLKQAGEKLFEKKAYYIGPTDEGVGFVYTF